MGPFEAQIEALLSERASDVIFVRKANAAFSDIAKLFDRLEQRDKFWDWFTEPVPGVFGIDLRNWPKLRKQFPGQLIFRPNAGPQIRHGLGRTKRGNIPVFVFTHHQHKKEMFSQWFPGQFHVWWKYGLRDIWRHEYTHWLDAQRNPTFFGSGSRLDTQGAAAYYNSPEELQAYYIEAVSRFFDTVEKIEQEDRDGEPVWKQVPQAQFQIGKNFREFLKKITDSPLHKDWIRSLTTENRRRIIKRAATTYDELMQRLNRVLPRDWQRWTGERIIAAAKAEKAAA